MKYQILLLPSAQKDLDSFEGKVFTRIRDVIVKLSHNPRPIGSQKLTNEDGHRIRVGDYRILYRIDDAQKRIIIYRVRHRREVYR
jgi:mRNA interferase RelE/StbE